MNAQNNSPKVVIFDGVDEESGHVIASKFNEYFIDSVSQINLSIEDVSEPDRLNFLVNSILEFFYPISYIVLKNICFSLVKSAGIDNVNAQIIKDCFHVIGHPLLNLINESL